MPKRQRKPVADKQAMRYRRVMAAIGKAERRIASAQASLVILVRKQRYYERTLAERKPDVAAEILVKQTLKAKRRREFAVGKEQLEATMRAGAQLRGLKSPKIIATFSAGHARAGRRTQIGWLAQGEPMGEVFYWFRGKGFFKGEFPTKGWVGKSKDTLLAPDIRQLESLP